MRFSFDDPSKRGPTDAARVNVSDDYEVRYRTTTLSVTKIRLIEAVTQVGTSVIAVRQELAPL
jgi:uncharacterized protein DUF3606